MKQEDPKNKPEQSGKKADANRPLARRSEELDGKTDSGPEPEVHGRDIPPQD